MNRQLITLSAIALGLATATAPSLAGTPSAPVAARCHGHQATIVGTSGDDTLRGTPERDVIAGLEGNDVIRAKAGHDLVCGGDGTDSLYGGRGNDELDGQKNADVLAGGHGDDRIDDRRNDRFYDIDTLEWYGDPNVIVDGRGSDVVRGRTHAHARDTLSFENARARVTLTWDAGVAHSGTNTDRFSGIDTIAGGPYADRLTGRDKPDVVDKIYGGDGNDVIRGLAGRDVLSAEVPTHGGGTDSHHAPGPGHELLVGGKGRDTLLSGGRVIFPGDARIRAHGGNGNDVIATGPYGGRIDGGPGSDLFYLHTHHRIHARLATGQVDGMNLRVARLEEYDLDVRARGNSVIGTPRADAVVTHGSTRRFRLEGRGGDDTLAASGTILGGPGADRVTCYWKCNARGGDGNDEIDSWGWPDPTDPRSARGGAGADRISWSAGPAFGGPGNDVVASYGDEAVEAPVHAGSGDDVLKPEGPGPLGNVMSFNGDAGDDTIDFGDFSPDWDAELRGVTVDLAAGTATDSPAGATTLVGIENAVGSAYADTLLGNDGDNHLTGGEGADSADGRGGTDTCTAETVSNCEK